VRCRLQVRFLSLLALLACVVAAPASHAKVELIPPYSISPDINNLNISYFARQDKVKITLYVINHEKFPVICDTRYESGPDKQHKLEQHIAPDKAVSFSYDYSNKQGGDPHRILLELQCVHREEAAVPAQQPGVKYYGDSPAAEQPKQ